MVSAIGKERVADINFGRLGCSVAFWEVKAYVLIGWSVSLADMRWRMGCIGDIVQHGHVMYSNGTAILAFYGVV